MDVNTALILVVLFVALANGVFQAVTLRAIIRVAVDIHATTQDIHAATRDIHETTRHTLELVLRQSQTRGQA